MEYNDNISELEEMKQQMELLKKRLNAQHIINEKLLMEAMKKKLFTIGRSGRQIFIMGIFVSLYTPFIFLRMDFSYWFCGATFIMLIFCALKTYQYHRELWRVNISEDNLVEIGEKVARFRKRYKEWHKIAYFMIIPWFIWIIIETYCMYGTGSVPFIAGAVIGGIIGGLAGTRINNNIIRRSDELLKQIQEYRIE